MAAAKEGDPIYNHKESASKISQRIFEPEYNKLLEMDNSETTQVGGLIYLDIYDGENKNDSALTARVIAGEEEPYHLTVTYHRLSNTDPELGKLEAVADIVGDEEIRQLLE